MGIVTKLTLGLLAAATMGTLSAQDLYKQGKATDFTPAIKVAQEKDAMLLKGTGSYVTVKSIKLDPAKKYQISGEFCQKSGKPVSILLGFVPYDAKGVVISPNAVLLNPKSMTTIAVAAKKGDKVIKVKDASKWNFKNKYAYIAFGAKKDFSDLPNRNLVATVLPNAKLNKGVWEIQLKAPLAKAIPAGTAVRQHTSGGTFVYTVGTGKLPANKWIARKGIISGYAKYGNPGNKMWAGTKSLKVLVLALQGDAKSMVLVRNVKVTQVK